MTIAEAVRELEAAAELGQVNSTAVATLRDALTLRESRADRRAWRARILAHLKKIGVGPLDVLVLRLPAEVIHDEVQMRQVKSAAADIADVAKRGVVILEEGAPLTAEALPKPAPAIHTPPPLILPPGART